MNIYTLSAIAAALLLGVARPSADADQPSEFDEAAIRAIQEAPGGLSSSQTAIVQAFEASNDPLVKAAKWEELVVAASEGVLSATWPTPSGCQSRSGRW